MARIRTIKPELWESQELGQLTRFARLTFIGLISLADDDGRGIADTRFLMGRLHPYSVDVKQEDMDAAFDELAQAPSHGGAPLAVFYEQAGRRYYWLPGFSKHQSIPKAKKWDSKLPAPPPIESKPPMNGTSKPHQKKPPQKQPEPPPQQEQEAPPAPRPKTNPQVIVEAFAKNRGINLSNTALQDRFFKTHITAALELDAMTDGNLEKALCAIEGISRYLDALVKEGTIESWSNLAAINKHYAEWKVICDRDHKHNGGENGAN